MFDPIRYPAHRLLKRPGQVPALMDADKQVPLPEGLCRLLERLDHPGLPKEKPEALAQPCGRKAQKPVDKTH